MSGNARIDAPIVSVTALLLRAAVVRPMVTSFATLRERTVLLVRIEDRDGACGWGEAYCNFPVHGGEHRLALLREMFAPRLLDRRPGAVADCFDEWTRETAVLALQTGEPGPIAQCIAALDMALWDLAGRRCGLPLAHLLAESRAPSVAAYATGLDPQGLPGSLLAQQALGHTAFKLKLGFGPARDAESVATARAVAPDAWLALDSNQAWDVDEARRMAHALERHDPVWLEEPLRADAPLDDWRRLAADSPIALAAGENQFTEAALCRMVDSGLFRFIQPDPVKWGGITGTARVAARARDAGVVFCPHYIGSGLGWAACLHLVAALGGAGSLVEVDPNENPLREMLAQPYPPLRAGGYAVPDGPGLGVAPDLRAAAPYLVDSFVLGSRPGPMAGL